MVDTESINPGVNKYLEKIESRLNRKARLAHEIGAGAPCLKCGDKCPGFELHYWRKLCLNCRCSKDDHDIQDDDEDIGFIIIGKLFDRPEPFRDGVSKGMSSAHDMQLKGKPQQQKKKKEIKTTTLALAALAPTPLQFDWVPPNVGPDLAARYMTALPPDKRPVAGSQAAKARKHQLEQQMPLYDMDETRRCEAMPTEELQQFKAHLDHVRSHVVGQGIVSEIQLAPKLLVGKLGKENGVRADGVKNVSGSEHVGQAVEGGNDYNNQRSPSKIPTFHVRDNTLMSRENSSGLDQRPLNVSSVIESSRFPSALSNITNNNLSEGFSYQPPRLSSQTSGGAWPAPPSSAELDLNEAQQQQRYSCDISTNNNNNNNVNHTRASFIGDMLLSKGIDFNSGQHMAISDNVADTLAGDIKGLDLAKSDSNSNKLLSPQPFKGKRDNMPASGVLVGNAALHSAVGDGGINDAASGTPLPSAASLDRWPTSARGFTAYSAGVAGEQAQLPWAAGQAQTAVGGQSLLDNENFSAGKQHLGNKAIDNLTPTPYGAAATAGNSPQHSPLRINPVKSPFLTRTIDPITGLPRPKSASQMTSSADPQFSSHEASGGHLGSPHKGAASLDALSYSPQHSNFPLVGASRQYGSSPSRVGGLNTDATNPVNANLVSSVPRNVSESQQHQAHSEPYRERLTGTQFHASSGDVNVLLPGESEVLYAKVQTAPSIADSQAQVSHHNCQQCTLPMVAGEVAVICERAGPQKFWHPGCFVCHECGELLADMIYFWHGSHVYCGRHYHQAASVPRCHDCDELIFSDSWTRAEGKDWHLSHFTCFLCDTALAGQSYVPSESAHPYCLPCHMMAQAQTCESCENKISPGSKQCQYRDYHYHATDQCFSCHGCRTPLLGGKFRMVKNWLFCSAECVDRCEEEILKNPATKFKHGDEQTK